MSENKFTKYLSYAVGEIVLVMIGILMALQVNNWNERRIEKRISIQTEHALVAELEAIKAQVEKVATFNETIFTNTNAYLAGDYTLTDETAGDVLFFCNFASLVIATPILDREVTSDKLIVGRADLNSQLREIHFKISRMIGWQKYIDDTWNSKIVPYLIKRNAMTEFRLVDAKKPFDLSVVPAIFTDNEYKQLVAMNNIFLSHTIGELTILKNTVDEALASLDTTSR